jgi:hypothetical protein
MATRRLVRTPQGAKFFGKPIGTVITEGDVMRAKTRAKRLNLPGEPPENALSDPIEDHPEKKDDPEAITITATHINPKTHKKIVSTFTVIGENQAKAVQNALEAAGATVTVNKHHYSGNKS